MRDREDEKKAFTKEIGCDEDIEFYEPESQSVGLWGTFFGAVEKIMPKSDVELATDIVENEGNGVLMYYAK